jgi:hypothetical protein
MELGQKRRRRILIEMNDRGCIWDMVDGDAGVDEFFPSYYIALNNDR